MSSAEQTAFVGALCWHVPELLPVMQEGLDYYEELLSHLLMADISRWVVERFQTDPADEPLRRVLGFIEESFVRGTTQGSQEIIHVSFLENLPRPGEDGFDVTALLGPTLQEQLKLVDSRYR